MFRRLRTASSVAAVTAALVGSALRGVAPAGAAPSPVGLPVMPSALAAGQSCTEASPTQAHARPWSAGALSLSRVNTLTQGTGVTVGVIDTGVATDIPALAGRVTAVGDAGQDCVGHGTFAAGLIAGADEATGGGVASQARILAVRGTDKTGLVSPHAVATGIRTAVDRGARVVYVGAALTDGRDELTDAVAYATRADVLVVAPAVPDALPSATFPGAAANTPPPQPYFPAFIPEVVSVEDYGPDGSRPKDAPPVFAADLAAPGDAMVSVGPRGTGHYIGSGSSLAAACVAVVSIAVLLGVAVIFMHVHLDAGQLAALTGLAALGIVTFTMLGAAVSTLVPAPDSALPVAYGTLLPLAFVSDVFFPSTSAPGWLRHLAEAFPISPLARSAELTFASPHGGWPMTNLQLGVTLGWFAAAAAVLGLAFRWEPGAVLVRGLRHQLQRGLHLFGSHRPAR